LLIPKLLALEPATHIMVLTGYASIATAVEAIKLGAVNYLPKPADADQIVAALTGAGGDALMPVNARPLDNSGNISATARQLNMHRRTLQRKLAKHPVKF